MLFSSGQVRKYSNKLNIIRKAFRRQMLVATNFGNIGTRYRACIAFIRNAINIVENIYNKMSILEKYQHYI